MKYFTKKSIIFTSLLIFFGMFFVFKYDVLSATIGETCTSDSDCQNSDGYIVKCNNKICPITPCSGEKVCTATTEKDTIPQKSNEAKPYNLQIDIGGTSGFDANDFKNGTAIGKYISIIYQYAVSIVGILAAVVMMWGGVRWITAGGNGEAVGEAKKWIGAALSGLVLVMTSYMVLYFVNPDLVNFKAIVVKPVGCNPICDDNEECVLGECKDRPTRKTIICLWENENKTMVCGYKAKDKCLGSKRGEIIKKTNCLSKCANLTMCNSFF